MSVQGEFQRVLADCLDLLREDGAGPLREPLRAAGRAAREDLADGARRALELLRGADGAGGADTALAREEFRERAEHLAAICRVILGE